LCNLGIFEAEVAAAAAAAAMIWVASLMGW